MKIYIYFILVMLYGCKSINPDCSKEYTKNIAIKFNENFTLNFRQYETINNELKVCFSKILYWNSIANGFVGPDYYLEIKFQNNNSKIKFDTTSWSEINGGVYNLQFDDSTKFKVVYLGSSFKLSNDKNYNKNEDSCEFSTTIKIEKIK